MSRLQQLTLQQLTQIVLATGLALGLAACTGGAAATERSRTGATPPATSGAGLATQPGTSPSDAAAGSPAAYSTTTPAQPPTIGTDVADKAHAVDFLLAWFQGLNRAFTTGDADILRETTSLACFTCANWIIEVQDLHDKKLTRVGGHVRLGTVVYRGEQNGQFTFRATLVREPGELRDAAGTSVGTQAQTGPEVVDLIIGISTSGITSKKTWTMKTIAAPPPDNGAPITPPK